MAVTEALPIRQAKTLLNILKPGEGEGVATRRELALWLRGKLDGGGLPEHLETLAGFAALSRADVERLKDCLPEEIDRLVDAVGEDVERLVKALQKAKPGGFAYARRLLTRLLKLSLVEEGQTPPRLWRRHAFLTQQLAVSTYKDPDLPADERLPRALKIIRSLHGDDAQDRADWHETYGITGAIYKRLWEYDSQKQNLERALDFYLKGYAVGAPNAAAREDVLAYLASGAVTVTTPEDKGFTGINAAFILDRLAYVEEAEASDAGTAAHGTDERRREASLIRREIFRTLRRMVQAEPAKYSLDWWLHATIAEALFGLGRYRWAIGWLRQTRSRIEEETGEPVTPWQFESTTRQFATLAYLKEGARSAADLEGTPLWDELADFLGSPAPVRSAFMGKVGLGLSGGGFRASFYHIGVLARLAEVGLLRHVEVLSCVSGGSIVGAHYYLKLRKLLEENPDGAVTTERYVGLVKELSGEFLAGVQRNVRTRVLAHLPSNLKVLLFSGYSRTLRVGELYERELYSRVGDCVRIRDAETGEERCEPYFTGSLHTPDWVARIFRRKRHPRYLADLNVTPLDRGGSRQESFNPKVDNVWRDNKVPVLIINAASLNTGHTWQFTTEWMGEPPAGIVSRIDGNDRLRRMYYRDAPLRFDDFGGPEALRRRWRLVRLGHAVAASSGVPGLFEPLAMEELFPGRVVRLVDGGVCDNQGVAGLLEQECTALIVSDGSGQSASEADPSQSRFGVLWRSDNILQARVREAQYRELAARQRASLLRSLTFVHLKQELDVRPTNWLYYNEPYEPADEEPPPRLRGAPAQSQTSYGFDRELQKRLSAVRTDLDSFNDVEAYALMLSGYKMTARYLRESMPEFAEPEYEVEGGWPFAAVESGVGGGGERFKFTSKVVKVGGSIAFKAWRLKWWLTALACVAAAAVAGAAVWFFRTFSETVVLSGLTLGEVGLWLRGFLFSTVVGLLIVGLFSKLFSAPEVGEKVKAAVFWRSTLQSLIVGTAMSVFGWLLAWVHLLVFDRIYKSHGSIEEFNRKRA